jgi:hypothetical protein
MSVFLGSSQGSISKMTNRCLAALTRRLVASGLLRSSGEP